MYKKTDNRRHLQIDGAHNLRDIGGYATRDGSETRWRTIFRSAGMSDMTLDGQKKLLDMGIRTVIDLRGGEEFEKSPNVFYDSPDVTYCRHDLVGEEIFAEWDVNPVEGTPVNRLSMMYKTILDRRGEEFRRILAILSKPINVPAIYHCSAGKDRTGIISALLLGIAGVTYDVIAEDYGLSAVYLHQRWLPLGLAPEGSNPQNYTVDDYRAQWCPPGAMDETLRYLYENYNGIEGYLISIGVTEDQITDIRNLFVNKSC